MKNNDNHTMDQIPIITKFLKISLFNPGIKSIKKKMKNEIFDAKIKGNES
jgi:hypothetical protein